MSFNIRLFISKTRDSILILGEDGQEIIGWLDVENPWTFSICVEGSTPSNHGSQCHETYCSEHQALPKLVLCCSLLGKIIRKRILLKKKEEKNWYLNVQLWHTKLLKILFQSHDIFGQYILLYIGPFNQDI